MMELRPRRLAHAFAWGAELNGLQRAPARWRIWRAVWQLQRRESRALNDESHRKWGRKHFPR